MHKYNSLPFDINRHPGIVNAAATYEIDDRSTHDQNTTHGGYLFPLVALMNRLRDYNVTDVSFIQAWAAIEARCILIIVHGPA